MIHAPAHLLCPCGVVHKPDLPAQVALRPYFGVAATVQLQVANGAGPTFASGESGFKYNREDTISGTTPVPIPTAAGTNYSWIKWLTLVVTTSGSTIMSNRRIQLSATETAGLGVYFLGSSAYVQAVSGNMPVASGSNGAVPTFTVGTPSGAATRATSGLIVYDSASISTSGVTGRNGNFCQTCTAVDNTYAGGAGNAVALPDVRLVYDEA